jgi:hypothetical protein
MSPADLRRQSPAAKGFAAPAALAVLSAVLLLAFFLFATAPHAAAAAGLTVAMDRSLTLADESAALTVSGDAIAALSPDDTIEVSIMGPAAFSQVVQADPALSRAGGFIVAAGSLPSAARPSGSQLHLPVPVASLPVSPGAYRVVVTVRSSGVLAAGGGTWMGRVARRASPVDLAFVWRAALGIHQDSVGRFIDQTLEQACTAGAASGSAQSSAGAAPPVAGTLPALAGLSSRFPGWRFSLGIEPVLLTQLRDMADGYTRADGSDAGVNVVAADPAAQNAKAVLSSLVGLAGGNSVEVAAGSYADADLGLLATLGWRDGFEQIQLGKQELVQTLALGLPPAGAFSPGLDLTGGSLGDYGQASIDHVLVDAGVASDLNEPIARDTVAVRAHDDANDRVTLVLADSDLRSLMASPWDPGVLFAGIAVVLASGDRNALVLTPGPEFALPPQSYLDAIGDELKKDPWIRTQTMGDLLKAHPPDTRPVLLTRNAALPGGYVGQTIFSAIQSAHASIDDLAAGADPANLSLESARRSLYVAESRWWSRPGVSPDEASAGLAYAVQAQAVCQGVLGKITFTGAKDALVLGHDGDVTLTAKNGGDSVITAELRLTGDGLRFPQGTVVTVRLEPGGNDIKVPVVGTSSSRKLTARLVVGKTVLGEQSASVRFVTVVDVLPWAAVAVVVIVLIAAAIVFARRRRRRRRK